MTLEELIRLHVHLIPSKRGWWEVLCKVCNDHGKKGRRAGFYFNLDQVSYNCFNCGHVANYNSNHREFSKDMKTVLDAFGIPVEEQNKILFDNMKRIYEHGFKDKPTKTTSLIEPATIVFPDHFYKLDPNSSDKWAIIATEYLKERKVDVHSHPFMLSTGESKTDRSAKKWKGRLIIPMFKQNKLIFYHGRQLVNLNKKYESCSVSRDNVFGEFDNLLLPNSDPIIVVEGWFDAKAIQGVAVLGSRMTASQIAWLNRTPREKIVIPDRYGSGYLLAEQAIKLGWNISTPDIGQCKDMSEAVQQFGYFYTKLSVLQNTSNGFEATTRMQIYCEDFTND
jgi:hypothetical protein